MAAFTAAPDVVEPVDVKPVEEQAAAPAPLETSKAVELDQEKQVLT